MSDNQQTINDSMFEVTPETAPKPSKNWVKDLGSRAGVVGELFSFLGKNKLWWMIPMIVVIVVFAVVIIGGSATPFAPLIYSLK